MPSTPVTVFGIKMPSAWPAMAAIAPQWKRFEPQASRRLSSSCVERLVQPNWSVR
jgi:hypothetical protein